MIVVTCALAVALVAALLLWLRARAGERIVRHALEGERRGRAADADAARSLREQVEASHRHRLADLERATQEKMALLAGSREELRREMQAISGEVLKGATDQLARTLEAARRVEHEQAKGELRVRATEIKDAE